MANVLRRRAWGIETRDPFGYLPFLEFCFAIPPEQYLLGGSPRSFARRVLADRLPRQVVEEKRRGRQCPECLHRVSASRERFAEELALLKHSTTASDLLDLPRMKAVLDSWPPRTADVNSGYAASLRDLVRAIHVGQFVRWVEGGCPTEIAQK